MKGQERFYNIAMMGWREEQAHKRLWNFQTLGMIFSLK